MSRQPRPERAIDLATLRLERIRGRRGTSSSSDEKLPSESDSVSDPREDKGFEEASSSADKPARVKRFFMEASRKDPTAVQHSLSHRQRPAAVCGSPSSDGTSRHPERSQNARFSEESDSEAFQLSFDTAPLQALIISVRASVYAGQSNRKWARVSSVSVVQAEHLPLSSRPSSSV